MTAPTPLRKTAGPLRLIATAIGGPRAVAGKLRRLGRTALLYVKPREVERRLETLLEYVRSYRQNPETPHLTRVEQTLRAAPHFAAAEQQFATLPGFLEYCGRLSTGFGRLLRRYRSVSVFPLEGQTLG